jgi:hypothetical protein
VSSNKIMTVRKLQSYSKACLLTLKHAFTELDTYILIQSAKSSNFADKRDSSDRDSLLTKGTLSQTESHSLTDSVTKLKK